MVANYCDCGKHLFATVTIAFIQAHLVYGGGGGQHISVAHILGIGNFIVVWGYDFVNYAFICSLGIVTTF